MSAQEGPASTRYELWGPDDPPFWRLRALGSAITGRLGRGMTPYGRQLVYRVRDKETGDFVHEVLAGAAGTEAGEVENSIIHDLDELGVEEFEREYGIKGRGE